MLRVLQDIFLSQWVVLVLLFLAFLFVSWWALRRVQEIPGYILGWMLGLFFIVVYASLGADATGDSVSPDIDLNLFQVFIATFLGVGFGVLVLVGLRYGMQYARVVALQVAAYTGLVIVLLFLTVVEGPFAQRMIGIFALAFGIATIFLYVLFPWTHRNPTPVTYDPQNAPPPQSPYTETGGSRLDEIRNKMRRR